MPSLPALASVPKEERVDFRTLFEREFAWVLRTLRYLGVRPADLEDVAHDVFLHVHRHWADYDVTRPPRPWLFVFVYRIARDFRRLARHRAAFSDDDTALVDPAPLSDAVLMQAERRNLALAALDRLDADERAVFVAHDVEELTAVEIASALGISVNTAYSRLRRAREKFERAARRLAKEPTR